MQEGAEKYVEQIRSADEMARRCIVLYAVVAAGNDVSRGDLVTWLRHEGLWDAVSPQEAEFLVSKSPTEQERFQAQWRAEALFPLLWALGFIAELPSPEQICDVQRMQDILPPLFGSVGEFVSSAKLRSDAEIHAANEEIYKIHWRVREFQLRNKPASPGKLRRMPVEDGNPPAASYNANVVQQRHYALNWLIGYCGQDWDDVTTDT